MNGRDLLAALFMGLTWTGVLALTAFCFWKVFEQDRKK